MEHVQMKHRNLIFSEEWEQSMLGAEPWLTVILERDRWPPILVEEFKFRFCCDVDPLPA